MINRCVCSLFSYRYFHSNEGKDITSRSVTNNNMTLRNNVLRKGNAFLCIIRCWSLIEIAAQLEPMNRFCYWKIFCVVNSLCILKDTVFISRAAVDTIIVLAAIVRIGSIDSL